MKVSYRFLYLHMKKETKEAGWTQSLVILSSSREVVMIDGCPECDDTNVKAKAAASMTAGKRSSDKVIMIHGIRPWEFQSSHVTVSFRRAQSPACNT